MTRTVQCVVLILLLFLGIAAIAAENGSEAAARYNEAGQLYRNGQFEESLAVYEDLIGRNYRDADLLYNAANAAFRSNKLGKAILYLEKAKRLAPSDDDIAANLAYLNGIKVDKEPVSDNPVAEFLINVYGRFNMNTAALWSGILFACAMGIFTLSLFVLGTKRAGALSAASLVMILSLASSAVLIEKNYRARTRVEAVVMDDEVPAYSGPGDENTHIFTIHEGTKVIVERSQSHWSLIRLKSGSGGWVLSESMAGI